MLRKKVLLASLLLLINSVCYADIFGSSSSITDLEDYPSVTDARYLLLDQSTPQTTIGTFTFPAINSPGAVTATGFTIGANTLDTNEFAPLDGINNLIHRDDANYNTFYGEQAGINNNAGMYCVALGRYALRGVNTGYFNTAIGETALGSNTSGYDNTALGQAALALNISGYNNTAIGVDSMNNMSSGNNNVALGYGTISLNTGGSWNSAIGSNTLVNSTGSFNTAVGMLALNRLTSGSSNVALGAYAGYWADSSNEFYLGNNYYDNNTDEKAKSLMYGVFNSAPASQTLRINGAVTLPYQLTSTLATGTSPLAITSTTVNTNLNADLWDGYQFSDYLDQAVKTTSSPTFTDITINGTNVLRHIYYRS